jgi:Fuc2NAc and GlcNAc transferase
MNLIFIWLVLVVVFSAACSCLLLSVLTPALRRSLLDQPNERSSHKQPTPRGGGIAFVLVAVVASLIALFANADFAFTKVALQLAPCLAFPLALVGILDDRYNLPPTWRYCAQLATAVAITLLSPLLGPSFVLGTLLVLTIAVTAVINFTNFMDGLDGLLASSMAVVIIAASIKLSAPWPIWSLLGALLGFLLWNWSPALVFMGDVGSTFLGAVFALLLLQAPTWTEALGLFLVATPLMGDACVCVLRRLMAGQRIVQAHRLHLYQRLHQAGWNHSRISILYATCTAGLATAFLMGGLPWIVSLACLVMLLGVWLDRQVAIPFNAAPRK